MSLQLKKLGRILVVLSIVIFTFIMIIPVQASSADFSGHLDNSDTYIAECLDYGEIHSFSVTTSGTYTMAFAATFNNLASSSAYVLAVISPTTSVYDQIGFLDKGSNVDSPITYFPPDLIADQTYYLIVTGCEYMALGHYSSVDFTITIAGAGDIIGGTPTPIPTDSDSDGVADTSDNCPNDANGGQEDADGDGTGNVCDSTPNGDNDSDGIDNLKDNCPDDANSGQEDSDSDGAGDACDSTPNGDNDGDTIDNLKDNCPDDANSGQEDSDSDGAGDACDSTPSGDTDSDGIDNATDNCPNDANADQTDSDSDSTGDACDNTPNGDTDSDGVDNATDNCPTTANAGQNDGDADGVGDACDVTPSGDVDSDGIDNAVDNCPTVANPGQADSDGDGIGNMCDATPDLDSDEDGVADIDDTCPNKGSRGFGVSDDGCPPHIVLPPDSRINWQYGDLNAVIYKHADGAVVYCHNGNTWLGMHVNQASVDAWDASQPQEIPVLEVDHAGCRTAFYILDSGEYQINVWSAEGKIYEMIANNLHFDNATMRYYDPNE
jgi:hypothetical protein